MVVKKKTEVKPNEEMLAFPAPAVAVLETTVVEPVKKELQLEEEKINKNVESRQAAEQILQLAKDEFGESELNERFWITLRDHAIEQVGLPSKGETKPIKPMKSHLVEGFKKDVMPRGKYAKMTVAAVLKRDPDYLKRFANSYDWFQLLICQFLAHLDEEQKKKGKRNK